MDRTLKRWAFVLAVVTLALVWPERGQTAVNRTVFVESVTDGDTFKTRDGTKVRLIGVDTPEVFFGAGAFDRMAPWDTWDRKGTASAAGCVSKRTHLGTATAPPSAFGFPPHAKSAAKISPTNTTQTLAPDVLAPCLVRGSRSIQQDPGCLTVTAMSWSRFLSGHLGPGGPRAALATWSPGGCLSIATSCSKTWADLWDLRNRFTTSTASKTITDWRTWNCGQPNSQPGVGYQTITAQGAAASIPDCYGPEASAFTKKHLTGDTVGLEFDLDRKDRYGRTLAYVHDKDFPGRTFNWVLVRRGFALARYYAPNGKYRASLEEAQKKASAQNVGLWKHCGGSK